MAQPRLEGLVDQPVVPGPNYPARTSEVPMMARPVLMLASIALVLSYQSVGAQEPPRQFRPPENVKILTELDGRALRAEMQKIAAGLGVKCDHCHVQGNFASDERTQKKTARRMLEMTRAINTQFFPKHEVKEGESILGRVTCFTCHQGKPDAPANAPPAK